ncbi:MAG: hypothetical protein RPS47_18380 [Colwellia sp.]
MLYSIILSAGWLVIFLGAAIFTYKIVMFCLELFFGKNYTIKYEARDGSTKIIRLRADHKLSVDELLASIEENDKGKPLS